VTNTTASFFFNLLDTQFAICSFLSPDTRFPDSINGEINDCSLRNLRCQSSSFHYTDALELTVFWVKKIDSGLATLPMRRGLRSLAARISSTPLAAAGVPLRGPHPRGLESRWRYSRCIRSAAACIGKVSGGLGNLS
jgi:hypothetical protein